MPTTVLFHSVLCVQLSRLSSMQLYKQCNSQYQALASDIKLCSGDFSSRYNHFSLKVTYTWFILLPPPICADMPFCWILKSETLLLTLWILFSAPEEALYLQHQRRVAVELGRLWLLHKTGFCLEQRKPVGFSSLSQGYLLRGHILPHCCGPGSTRDVCCAVEGSEQACKLCAITVQSLVF